MGRLVDCLLILTARVLGLAVRSLWSCVCVARL